MDEAEATRADDAGRPGIAHKRLSIRQLEAFRAFMLARSTKGAAEILGVSQPAVSKLIDQLELSLRFELFDRKNGRLVPTPEAGLLFDAVERTFVSVDKIFEMARDIQSARVGSLTIATMPAIGYGFLPAVIARFAKRHPHARVSVLVSPSTKIEELVSAHHVDFGLAEFPVVRSGVHAAEFCNAPYVLAVAAGHRLTTLKRVSAPDLADEPFISLTSNTAARHLIDQHFAELGVRRQQYYEAQNSAVIAAMVVEGLGVGLIDPFTAHDFRGRGLDILPFHPPIPCHVAVLHPGHRPLSRVGRQFLSLLQKVRKERRIV